MCLVNEIYYKYCKIGVVFLLRCLLILSLRKVFVIFLNVYI